MSLFAFICEYDKYKSAFVSEIDVGRTFVRLVNEGDLRTAYTLLNAVNVTKP